MSNWYLKLSGKIAVATIGKRDHYSEEHQKFLLSGYTCQHCKKTLMKWWVVPNVNCYAASGEKVPVAVARLKGRVFECPKCQHRWEFRTVS